VSTWVQPINLTINSKFGSRLYEGAGVSAIEYATNLYLVIAGVFILSVTNVIFPKLSRLSADGQGNALRDTVRQTLHSSLFFVLPMSAGLMVVSRPLISFLYGGGAFDEFSVDITSAALALVCLGMAGYAVQNILSRVYFARQNGRAPLVAGAISIGVNVVLCMVLTDSLLVNGLAVASAASSTVYALLLLVPLVREDKQLLSDGFVPDLVKMLLATLAMAAAAFAVWQGAAVLLPEGKLFLLVGLGLCAGAGAVVYFLCTWCLKLEEARLSADLVKRLLKRG
jgi:putative peptidoglycan lipid II flippase